MSSVHRTTPLKEQADPDELAGAKLWSVYVSEAEKYDKALVEGWRADMEGLLIFAGLFSASLTAFLIESYKSLSPDQGAITIAILAQISLQLQGGSNVSAVDVTPLMTARPTSAALFCNTLWFLSLGFSLACALIATLVEQWSRHFIHSSELKQSPIIRARIFAYLYHGLERFGMYAMVQFIPLLLHISLLLFFVGLVAFLQPINAVVTAMAAALLASISIVYMYLTVLPMFSSDAPYRTPLSNILWGFFRQVYALFLSGWKWSPDEEAAIVSSQPPSEHKGIPTMIDIMIHDATDKSEGRAKRDRHAMVWAVRSLSDDELEPIMEALPELVWGPTGRRRLYNDMINLLLETSDLQLVSRIEALLRGCDTGFFAPDLQVRRRICCIKALWALACVSVSEASKRQSFPIFDHTMLASQLTSVNVTPTLMSHLTSVYALVRCSDLCSLLSFIRDIIPVLENITNTSPVQNVGTILRKIQNRAADLSFTGFSSVLEQFIVSDSTDTSSLVQRSVDALKSCNDLAYDILAEYLRSSGSVEEMPYEFEATSSMIQQVALRPSTTAAMKLKDTFIAIVETNAQTILRHETIHPLDISLDAILHLLQGNPECLDTVFLRLFLLYMGGRTKTKEVWARILPTCDPRFMGSLLTKCLATFNGRLEETLKDTTLTVIWFSCYRVYCRFAIFDEQTVMAVQAAQQTFLSSCTVAVLKAGILRRASGVPALTSYAVPPKLSEQQREEFCTILAEFLEARGRFPLNNSDKDVETETFSLLTFYVSGTPSFSRSFQRRFANSLLKILNGDSPTLSAVIVRWIGWYDGSPPIQSFDDPNARATILKASKTFAASPTFLELAQTDIPGIVKALIAELASDESNPAAGTPIDTGGLSTNVTGTPEVAKSGDIPEFTGPALPQD
ncbi:hypothetical protein B0H16DRAFT_1693129 [Mycena metata]|uniref:DUF6535 domain-containing protein n=1 Tax=Mycena metata TaxID=1033252 RepID=A0AAD7ILM6_9AGAR|nr:hypothetical protein B0H16DRAFT_1693129 [Mycena metata]